MMALLVFTIIEAPAYGWTSARSLAGFAVSAVLLAAFIAAERRAAHPMLDVRLFRNPRFSAASGAVTVSFFTLLGFIFLITQYFQFVRGYSALSAGVRLLPVALAVAVGSVAGTQLAVRAGTKLIVTIGLVAMAVFYGWVAATTSATLSYGVIAVQMVLYGLGMGLTSAPATEAIMGAVSRSKAGRRLGRQRRHPAHRRHARRRRARQRLRLRLRVAAHRHHPGRRARPGRGARAPVGRRGLRGGRRPRAARPPRARPGAAARVHQRVPARPHHRRPGGRRGRGGGSDPGGRVPPRPARAQPRRPPAGGVASGADDETEPRNFRAHTEGITPMTGRITRQRDVESLKIAARWPDADKNTIVTLASRLVRPRRTPRATDTSRDLSDAQPDAATAARPGRVLPGTARRGRAATSAARWPSWTGPRRPTSACRSTPAGWR